MKPESLKKAAIEKARQFAADRVPYRHRGTSRRGCDCTGMLIAILQELGFLKDYVLREYPPDWNLHGGAGDWIVWEIEKFCDRLQSAAAAGPGDIAVMRFGRCPAHCGLVVSPGLMIHCFRDARRCCYGKLRNSPWSARWIASYSLNLEKLCS